MNSPSTSVVVAGAVRSAARLVVMLCVVVRAHVKDGVQTACRHNLNFAHFRRIILHTANPTKVEAGESKVSVNTYMEAILTKGHTIPTNHASVD